MCVTDAIDINHATETSCIGRINSRDCFDFKESKDSEGKRIPAVWRKVNDLFQPCDRVHDVLFSDAHAARGGAGGTEVNSLLHRL